jgi:hypothetical protein
LAAHPDQYQPPISFENGRKPEGLRRHASLWGSDVFATGVAANVNCTREKYVELLERPHGLSQRVTREVDGDRSRGGATTQTYLHPTQEDLIARMKQVEW